MHIFCDTEFTDFKHMDLISLGLVSEDGKHEFYVEINDHDVNHRSEFVNEVVVPLLDPKACGKSYADATVALCDWLNSLPCDTVVLVFDYQGDWSLIMKMLQLQPPQKTICPVMLLPAFVNALQCRGVHSLDQINAAGKTMMREMQRYFDIDHRQHHALVDAKANRHGWVAGIQSI